MKIESWDDIRTALAVARLGTVSAAAAELGVHHATIIRRIDALERQLSARLFQRHARGYALTDAGQVLLRLAGDTDERLAQMASQIAGAGAQIEGELVITALPELNNLLMPAVIRLMGDHPGLRLRFMTDARLYRLDAGEAHIAIRAGEKPDAADYVVRFFTKVSVRLYAAPAYLQRFGPVEQLADHRIAVATGSKDSNKGPQWTWLRERLPEQNFAFISNDFRAVEALVRSGLALGVLPVMRSDGLTEVLAPPEWDADLWLVTHVDLHRSPTIQAALEALRASLSG